MTQDERFDRLDAGIARIDANIGRLTQFLLDFREETARHFEVIDNRLDVLTATVANIEARYPH